MTGTTHADSLALPDSVQTKAEFYDHVTETLGHLLAPASPPDGTSNLCTTGSNAASLLFGSFENYEAAWGREAGRRVNWAGFYLHPSLLSRSSSTPLKDLPSTLILGPFHGRPACNSVSLKPTKTRPVGVCAAAFLAGETVVVPDVEARPGHIACDGVTKSEVVVPVKVGDVVVGVLDVDCEGLGAFGEEDRVGLEKFVEAFVKVVDWDL